jgi:glutathione S-transferase
MQLYFSPLTCSLATRIALYEAGQEPTFIEVDSLTKQTRDGVAYSTVNPLGLVPTLRTDDGECLTETAAILQYLARRFPAARLAPTDERGLVALQQWLSFVGTELHRRLFGWFFDRQAPDAVKAYALEKGRSRLQFLDGYLAGREHLLDHFTVADAYLVTVLGWSVVTPLGLGEWPALSAYVERVQARPSVARARAAEIPLYLEERARHAAAGQQPRPLPRG